MTIVYSGPGGGLSGDVLGDVHSSIVAYLFILKLAEVHAIVLNSCGSVPKWVEDSRGQVVSGGPASSTECLVGKAILNVTCVA